jgi:hypothetical protein
LSGLVGVIATLSILVDPAFEMSLPGMELDVQNGLVARFWIVDDD